MSPALILSSGLPPHGGNLIQEASRLGLSPSQLLDASASLVPFRPPRVLRRALKQAIAGSALRDYPDRDQRELRQVIARWHGLHPEAVLPGNGAAELFTWAARDASVCGVSARLNRCWREPGAIKGFIGAHHAIEVRTQEPRAGGEGSR